MEVMIYLLQIFFDNSLLLLEDIHKVWRGCLVLFPRYDFLKLCFQKVIHPKIYHFLKFLLISLNNLFKYYLEFWERSGRCGLNFDSFFMYHPPTPLPSCSWFRLEFHHFPPHQLTIQFHVWASLKWLNVTYTRYRYCR